MNMPMITETITANANPMETWTIMRAQSLLTKGGVVGPVLSYKDALDVCRDHDEAQAEQFEH